MNVLVYYSRTKRTNFISGGGALRINDSDIQDCIINKSPDYRQYCGYASHLYSLSLISFCRKIYRCGTGMRSFFDHLQPGESKTYTAAFAVKKSVMDLSQIFGSRTIYRSKKRKVNAPKGNNNDSKFELWGQNWVIISHAEEQSFFFRVLREPPALYTLEPKLSHDSFIVSNPVTLTFVDN
jgi:hypothetical protein